MEEENKDVKSEDETSTEESTDNKDSEASEGVKTPEEEAAELLDSGNRDRILVDKSRFNDRNDKAKLYEIFAPIIDKVKDNPELVENILKTKEKGSLEDRVAQMEEDRKSEKRKEANQAVIDALKRWPTLKQDWPEMKEQVDTLAKKLSFAEAIRRSYIALHPEEALKESERITRENANALGEHQSGSGHSPHIDFHKKEESLNERERIVAHDLLGKDFGNGQVLIKSEEDYAKLLKKHEAHLKQNGFYDLP